ncbi:nucleotidyl transferase AbiEii/AbiGii toxin family protein [Streptomyces sp. R302]|uniref:nucleotidyl transferase AbiEii/AbiGii toxin family protein n=1 Tax=unclassified Streptomyces TaxID=2593676 RepID=UPI00145DBD1A|nr:MULTISPECIES: nucleotidyl transferase AbiEii/AbiGii toxin family protein [unclassified Streptomyces]NML54608.1 nucleotidyl transferase AbiEii/AbiGii toxin family protein [Streptomyces sp. R301]NML82595.1 nucleotidyl transferase AbiEii/AbiGii toxin family protein [Streptomyces sp. R302]
MSDSGTTWTDPIPNGPGTAGEPAAEYRRRSSAHPSTLTAGVGAAAVRHHAFDPALMHFREAFRPTDDVIEDPELRARWQAARRSALDLVLAAVAGSAWADSLVLRGSMLMSAWFGEAARPPKDIDFVVVPETWRIEEPRTRTMLDDIGRSAGRLARALDLDLVIDDAGAVTEYIWTYERVPGHRLVLPWSAPGLPGGQVQLDFVFHERLPTPPRPTEVAGVQVRAADRELSLAWKLLWLSCDMHPQAKDLYDAVLLAESCTLPLPLLETVLKEADEWPLDIGVPFGPAVFEQAAREVDWAAFPDDHAGAGKDSGPSLREELATRLVTALAPTFAS